MRILRALDRGLDAVQRRLDRPGLARRRLPAGFDWRSYLARYPDLAAAEVDDEATAIHHWLRHGRAEGRWCTRPSYPTRRAMTCDSMCSIFLRAWGSLACWDDAGSAVELQPFGPKVDYGADVYLGPVFNRIRRSLAEGRMPHPEACRRCLCLHTASEHSSYHLDARVVELFQAEPSYLCDLDCPGCVRRELRRYAPKPLNLAPSVLDGILGDLRRSGVTVRRFRFQGHGEPLLNPQLATLARLVKRNYPASFLAVDTNANQPLRDEYLDAGFDEFVCSIDGVDQSSYEPYRVGGSFGRAYRFMAELARGARRRRGRPRVVWRYVIFEHNDDEDRLRAAQHMASEIGVDELVFVFTRNGPRSRRVLRPEQIPLEGVDVPVGVRFHEPSVVELANRVASARAQLVTGQTDSAIDLLTSSIEILARFFPEPADLEPCHHDLVARLTETIGLLPVERRDAIVEPATHLIG